METTTSHVFSVSDLTKTYDQRITMFALTTTFLATLAVVSSAKLSRIINGEEAVKGEFPHQVSLLLNYYHICGGSVIADEWILTAAHCVDGSSASDLAIAVDLHDFSATAGVSVLEVVQVIMHPNYNMGSGGFPNDVALLRVIVPASVDLSKNIIPLASGSDLFVNNDCVISGWGVTETGYSPNRLLKAEVRVLSESDCESHWGQRNILGQHICVMGETTYLGSGSCNGDSGGPLVCNGVLAGVTSWGISGCHDNGMVTHPSVYARVSSFYSWINNNCGNCAA